jgi:hypothetical protein
MGFGFFDLGASRKGCHSGYSLVGDIRNFGAGNCGILIALEASLYVDVLRSFDTKTNPVTANLQYRDFNLIGDNNLLVFLSADDEHGGKLLLPKRTKRRPQKYKRL